MAVTNKQVVNNMKIFCNIDDDNVGTAINMATSQVEADKIADSVSDLAVIYFARHLLYVDWFNSNGGVISGTAFGNSNSFANPNETDDGWLQQYKNIAKSFGQAADKGFLKSYD